MAGSSSAPSRRSTRMCSWRASGSCCCSSRNRRMASLRGRNAPPETPVLERAASASSERRRTPARDLYVSRSPPGPVPPDRNPTPRRSASRDSCASAKVNAEPSFDGPGAWLRASTWRTCLRSMASSTSASARLDAVTCMSAASADDLASAASCCASSNADSVSGASQSSPSSPSSPANRSVHVFSLSHAAVSSLMRAATCPRKSRASSRTRISGELMPWLERSCAQRLRSIRLATGHSGMFSATSRSDTRFCMSALMSISCARAECHPLSSSFQK